MAKTVKPPKFDTSFNFGANVAPKKKTRRKKGKRGQKRGGFGGGS